MSDEARRIVERQSALDPHDEVTLRRLCAERKRLGDEWLPAVVYEALPAFDRESVERCLFTYGPSRLSETFHAWFLTRELLADVRWYWSNRWLGLPARREQVRHR